MLLIFLYLAGSAVAIGLLALLMHRLGQSAVTPLDGEAEARAQFLADYPDEDIERVELAVDGTAALLTLAGGGVGAVRAMGRHHVARRLDPAQIAAVARDGARLQLRLKDYNDPSFAIELTSAAAAQRWQSALEQALTRTQEHTQTQDRPAPEQ